MRKDEELQILDEFGRKMEKSYEQWYQEHKGTLNPPPLDLSFMDQELELPGERDTTDVAGQHRNATFGAEPPQHTLSGTNSANPDAESTSPAPSAPRRKTLLRKFWNIAAVFLVVAVVSAGMAAWVNSNAVHALKHHIEKFFHETSDHLYSTGEGESSDDDVIFMKVTDPKELDTLKRRIPELMIPKDLPEGYTFSLAEAEIRTDGSWSVKMDYSHSTGNVINLTEENTSDQTASGLEETAEVIETNNGKIYYTEGEHWGEVTFVADGLVIKISGTVERDDLIQIAEGLE